MIPPIESKTGAQLHVGGITAIFEDFGDAISEKLPLFIGVVILLSALLLMAVFRSMLVPLKAMVMNLLSIGAAFGIIVAVFQWGWGASIIGVDNTGPIIAFFPIFLFSIVFGLSMDYEVFLMSRIHEEWEESNEASEAVTRGLALTGRVITAAAAIMVTVFASFMLGEERIIKLFGLGLASAVLIDAVIIRSILVPALMQLFGRRAWYLPAWLARMLPRLSVEPSEVKATARRADEAAAHATGPGPRAPVPAVALCDSRPELKYVPVSSIPARPDLNGPTPPRLRSELRGHADRSRPRWGLPRGNVPKRRIGNADQSPELAKARTSGDRDRQVANSIRRGIPNPRPAGAPRRP